MEGTSRALFNTIKFVGLLGSHALGRNPRFMATAVDLGRELVRRKIRLTYGGGNISLQGAIASTVYNNGGRVRGFIPGYIATRGVYGPTYGAEYTVSSNYNKYFEMNHIVEAFIVLPGGIDTIEGLFTLISWASEGLHSRPIGLLNIDGYFNNLYKFLDDAVRQNFMALNQRKLFISSFFVDELLDKLEFAKAFPGPGASYEEFANPGSYEARNGRPFGATVDLDLHEVRLEIHRDGRPRWTDGRPLLTRGGRRHLAGQATVDRWPPAVDRWSDSLVIRQMNLEPIPEGIEEVIMSQESTHGQYVPEPEHVSVHTVNTEGSSFTPPGDGGQQQNQPEPAGQPPVVPPQVVPPPVMPPLAMPQVAYEP
ncbi:hypothetical protein DM860_015099 [Cuscuta australis]|uniref:cytokinin riboside 5'-monophosphate phosphoribohydrolase n=1 Tax=Cuscuta australis TaxID=267555 RepID=A0A328DXB3_9ASTE|nr:hypothetical protein DM860_015099 [Cuscuta australis]